MVHHELNSTGVDSSGARGFGPFFEEFGWDQVLQVFRDNPPDIRKTAATAGFGVTLLLGHHEQTVGDAHEREGSDSEWLLPEESRQPVRDGSVEEFHTL